MSTELFRAVLVGDVHLSDKAPRSRLDDYTETAFEKLLEIQMFAAEKKAHYIIQCGDFFHIKQPSRVSHRLVARATRLLKSSEVPWVIVPGNHDLPNGNLEQLHRTPLGVLYASGAAQIPIPHIDIAVAETWGDSRETKWVRIHGAQFTYSMDKDDATREVYYPDTRINPDHGEIFFTLTVSHGTLIHGQGTFYGDYTNPRMLDLDRCANVTFNGHLHFGFDDEIIEHGGRTLTFVNPGSVMRGSLDEYNREFRPKVRLLRVSLDANYSIETYFLRAAKDASEVLDFSSKVLATEDNEKIVKYVETLSEELSTHELVSTYDDLISTVHKLEIADSVKQKTIDLLERAYESTI